MNDKNSDEALCRSEYRPLHPDPTARIVRCNLPKGHVGRHDEVIDGEKGHNTWAQEEPLAEWERDLLLGQRQQVLTLPADVAAELLAMQRIVDALEAIPVEARGRVLVWVGDRYLVTWDPS